MRKRKIQFGALLITALALLVVGVVGLSLRAEGETDSEFKTPYGKVVWSHELHARLKQFSCQVCHHPDRPGSTSPSPCGKCHKSFSISEKATENEAEDSAKKGSPGMIANHAKCIGCHHAVHKGPVGCRECHAVSAEKFKKPAASDLNADDGPQISKLNHLVAKYEPVKFNHKDHVDYAEGCESCHHKQTEVEAVASCRSCHNTKETAKGSKKLGLKYAYHKQCIGCHEELESGPTACGDCHAELPEGAKSDTELTGEDGPALSKLHHLSQFYEAVRFTHSDHVEYADNCQVCHHAKSEVEEAPACRECHDTAYNKPKDKKLGLIDAYHVQCMNCHIEMESGPLTCTECHKEKKK